MHRVVRIRAATLWLDVSPWGKRGEVAARLLRKGARVSVSGELYEEGWQDKDTDEERRRLRLRADHVEPELSRLDALTWRPRSEEAGWKERIHGNGQAIVPASARRQEFESNTAAVGG